MPQDKRNIYKIAREAKGLTQEAAAEKLGISLRVYQYYEHGDRTPPMETLIALADLYDITLDELVCRHR